MRSWQLVGLSILLSCLRLSQAQFLSRRAPVYGGHPLTQVDSKPGAEPERKNSRQSVHQASGFQTKQVQRAVEPLSWKFPEYPVDQENKPPRLKFLKPVAPTNRVALRCGENKIQVEVNRNLRGLGKLITPEELTLGGCSATETDDSSHVLVFEAELHSCGSRVVMTDNALIYAFKLVYKPKALGSSNIVRSERAVIGVECHYPK